MIFVVTVIVSPFAMLFSALKDPEQDPDSVKSGLYVTIIVACFAVLLVMTHNAQESRTASIQHCLDENYSICMDGKRVKDEDIDVFDYKVKIDKKHKKLILSSTGS